MFVHIKFACTLSKPHFSVNKAGDNCNSEVAGTENIPHDARQTDMPHLGSASLLHTAAGSPGVSLNQPTQMAQRHGHKCMA